MFCFMAKNRDGGGSYRGMNSKGKTVGFVPPKGMPQFPHVAPVTAFVGKPTKQSAADKAATVKANKNPQFSGKNVPVVKSSSWSLRGMQGSSSFQPTKSQIAKGVGAVLPAGVAKTVLNTYLFGKKVIHSSPSSGLKKIETRTGSGALPKEDVNFSFGASKVRGEQNLKRMIGESKTYVQQHSGTGSMYVGRVQRGSIKRDVPPQAKGETHVIANKPIKVSKEYSLEDPKLLEKLQKDIRGKERTPLKKKIEQQKLKKSLRTKKEMDVA